MSEWCHFTPHHPSPQISGSRASPSMWIYHHFGKAKQHLIKVMNLEVLGDGNTEIVTAPSDKEATNRNRILSVSDVNKMEEGSTSSEDFAP